MQLLTDVDQLPAGLRFVIAVGMFDGVHRGHSRMLKTEVAAAERLAATPVALTFDPHPDAVLRGTSPPLLCDPTEKVALLAAAGAHYVVVQPFDRRFADQSAESFLRRLAGGRSLAGVVMTEETAFGRDRAGTLAAVEKLAPTAPRKPKTSPFLTLKPTPSSACTSAKRLVSPDISSIAHQRTDSAQSRRGRRWTPCRSRAVI